MALKFRRGTTAQKSGSLAFGEPYVNTTLGTLQIGGPDGDITLGSTGTGSTGTFGAISGSGLDITGNANIAGNLTLGGQLTIGDNTSDTVNVVASLSSSLIPSVDNVFDLGSQTKIWRDLYISTGSINVVAAGAILSSITTNADGSQTFPNGLYSQANITIGSGSYVNIGKFEIGRRGDTPDNNTVLGIDVMPDLTTGEFNTGIGRGTLYNLTTGGNNIAMGDQAGYSMVNGVGNITIGKSAAFTLADPGGVNGQPVSNTFVGDGVGGYVNSGFYTTAIGGNALLGQNGVTDRFIKNTAIGYGAGSYLTGIATNNLYLGANAGPSSYTNESYKFYVSNGEVGDQPFMYGDMTNSSRTLDINASTTISGSLSVSTLTGIGNVTTYSTSVNSRLAAAESFSSSLDSTFATDASVTSLSSSVKAVTDTFATSASVASATATSITSLSSSVKAVTDTFATSASVASATATSISTLSGSVKTVTDALSGRVTTLEGTDISITLTGDVTGTGTITNLANVSFATTIAANSVALGTDTTGDYVASLVAGTGVTLSNNSGEGATPTISIGQAVATNSAVSFASVSATGDIVAFSSSDRRFKNNIVNISDALNKVKQLNGVTWEWNDDVNDVTKSSPKTGLIAQEVQEVLPEVVSEREDGYLGLDYSKMVGLLVEAIKEQQTQIAELKAEVEALKK